MNATADAVFDPAAGDAPLVDAVERFLAARAGAPSEIAPGVFLAGVTSAGPAGAVVLGGDAPGPSAAQAGIAALRSAGAQGRVAVVARGRAGFGPADLSALAAADAALLTPLQFFDWDFRRDQSDAAAAGVSARLHQSVDRALISARAPQPYARLDRVAEAAPGDAAAGPDLFAALAPGVAGPADRARLIVVAGPAGAGKTVLANALAAHAHDAFNDAKRRVGVAAARPFYFEPAGLGSQTAGTVAALFDHLLAGELAAHAPASAFEWLLTSGYGLWVFDGLDEFFRGQADFFPRLDALLSAPGSRARVVICTRDSLLSSSEALQAFLRARLDRDPGGVEIYELLRWRADDKRAFIRRRLEAAGFSGAALEARTEDTLAGIEARPDLAALTDLPFYCATFVDAALANRAITAADEMTLLQWAVDALFERESEKLGLDWSLFVGEDDLAEARALAERAMARGLAADGANPFASALSAYGQAALERLIGAAAHFYRFASVDAHAGAEISLADWREAFEPGAIGARLTPEEEERLSLALLQFAVFQRGDSGQGVGFVHELVAEFLAAKYAMWMIEERPEAPRAWTGALGRRADLDQTVLFRAVAARVAQRPDLLSALERAAADPGLTSDDAARLGRLAAAARA